MPSITSAQTRVCFCGAGKASTSAKHRQRWPRAGTGQKCERYQNLPCVDPIDPACDELVMSRGQVSCDGAVPEQAAKQEDHVLALEADMDRTLLRLYQQALKADRWSPASSVANVFLY